MQTPHYRSTATNALSRSTGRRYSWDGKNLSESSVVLFSIKNQWIYRRSRRGNICALWHTERKAECRWDFRFIWVHMNELAKRLSVSVYELAAQHFENLEVKDYTRQERFQRSRSWRLTGRMGLEALNIATHHWCPPAECWAPSTWATLEVPMVSLVQICPSWPPQAPRL